MRIIFLNRYFFPDHSATSQMLSELAFYLAESGFSVTVITSRQRYDDAGAMLPASERIRGVEVHRVRTSRFGRTHLAGRTADYASFYLTAGWRLWRLVHRRDVIIAKTDPPLISVVAWLIARWRGATLVNWLQDVFPEIAERLRLPLLAGPQARLLRWLRNHALRAAGMNVVLGESMAAVAAGAGVPAKRIQILPNWADREIIYPVPASANPLRRAWGLEAKCCVCYSGNMGRAHEFETILDAAQLLAERSPAIEFLFIGGGARHGWLETAVRQRGLANVQFHPYQESANLHLSLSAGDIHLVSLRPELEGYVFPSKLYGILAAGRPVAFIGDAQGEIARLVQQEALGIVVSQGDAAGLADELKRLAHDAPLRHTMGNRARALLCKQYDKAIALSRWRALLAAL